MTTNSTQTVHIIHKAIIALFLSNRKVIILLLTREENQDVVKVR